ncbi:MAG: type II secretion system minor pseudopilin GspI [Sulfuriflexus sp.]|nr:type II secretion system minor pseudopilin GspI [Sulfuriflexus sp.]
MAINNSAHSMKGMTLIEVLVALVIIAVALSAAIRSVNAGVANTDYLKQKSFAHWVAMNEIAEQQVNGIEGVKNEWKEVEMVGRSWHINTKVIATAERAIFRVETKVYRERNDAAALANIVSFESIIRAFNPAGVRQ